MPTKKYVVTLTKEERAILSETLNKGKHSAEKRKRAQALLLAGKDYTDDMIVCCADGYMSLIRRQERVFGRFPVTDGPGTKD
jgi:hypothetical protein